MSKRNPEAARIVRRKAGGVCLNEPLGDLSSVLSRLCRLRGLSTAEQASLSLTHLLRPDLIPHLDEGTELLHTALKSGWKILILGDFDADGATSTAVCVRSLQWMGARSIKYLLPNRFDYGYGLSIPVAELALRHEPQLIITVDNGISSVEAAKFLRAQGVHLLITDHHQPGDVLPDADVIINPKLAGDYAPGVNLAGVGVIYYLMLGLRARLDKAGWFDEHKIKRPNMARLLDLVALGTVADRVPLDHANRILVQQGLLRIRRNLGSPGINAMITAAKRSKTNFSSSDLGYYLGPRLNAAGRLGEMALGVACLLAKDQVAASDASDALSELNDKRRALESELFAIALADLAARGVVPNSPNVPAAIVVFGDAWHVGVTGILSSRINALFNRPVWVFTRVDTGLYRGSGRSIKGIHLFEVLQRLNHQEESLLVRFGGHAMAAGATLHFEDAERFVQAFTHEVSKQRLLLDSPPDWLTDGALSADELTLKTAHAIRTQMPWGEQFPEPMFDGSFVVVAATRLAGKHLKLKLQPDVTNPDHTIDAIYFNCELESDPTPRSIWQFVYSLEVNEFRDQRTVQMILRYARPHSGDGVN